MNKIFDINAPSSTIFLDTKRRGEGIVVLTNTLERKIQGRVFIESDNPALKQVVSVIDGERVFLPNEAQQFTIRVEAPETFKGGMYRFRIIALDVDAPDDSYQKGPQILFIAPPPANTALIAAAIIAAIIALLVVIGVVVGIIFLLSSFEDSGGIDSQIAYTTVIDGRQVIEFYDLAAADTLLEMPTPANPADEHSPIWSPEGRRLAFISDRSGQLVNGRTQPQWSLYTLNVQDPSRVLRIDEDIFGVTAFAWSPDGERLAYVRQNSATSYNIIQIEANGDSPTQLYTSDQPIQSLSYYPDGRGLTFIQDFLVKFLLFGEAQPQNLLSVETQRSNFGLVLDASWSAGGDVLALSALSDPATRRVASIFRIDFASISSESPPVITDESIVRLTFGHNDRNPVWSLDGRRIVFISTTRNTQGYLPRPYFILARADQEAQPLDVPQAIAVFQPNLQPRFDQQAQPTASPTVTNTPTPTPSATPTSTPEAQ